MSVTHLKLMVDYNLNDPEIMSELQRIGALKAKTIIECGFKQDTDDNTLVGATEDHGLLLTGDKNTIDEHKYRPCTHGGIIIIKHRRPTPQEIFRRMKAFCESGERKHAKGHVTHLMKDGGIIYTHKKPITFSYA